MSRSVTCTLFPSTQPIRTRPRWRTLQTPLTRISTRSLCNKKPEGEPVQEHQDEDQLLPSEDWTVPGGSNDSLSSNTDLGKAVRSAVDELEHLGKLEEEVLNEAFDLLDKLVKRPGNKNEDT